VQRTDRTAAKKLKLAAVFVHISTSKEMNSK